MRSEIIEYSIDLPRGAFSVQLIDSCFDPVSAIRSIVSRECSVGLIFICRDRRVRSVITEQLNEREQKTPRDPLLSLSFFKGASKILSIVAPTLFT